MIEITRRRRKTGERGGGCPKNFFGEFPSNPILPILIIAFGATSVSNGIFKIMMTIMMVKIIVTIITMLESRTLKI